MQRRHGRSRRWCATPTTRRQAVAAHGAELVRGDIGDSGVRAQMAGADVVLHNAGVYELGAHAELCGACSRSTYKAPRTCRREIGRPKRRRFTYRCLGARAEWPGSRRRIAPPPGTYRSAYEQSKVEAENAALRWRARGPPLVIGMPKASSVPTIIGVGQFLRLYRRTRCRRSPGTAT